MIRKIVQIDEEKCNGCGLCVPSCAEGAIKIENGKARLSADNLCDGLGACLGDCPQDAIRIIEREADEFDEAAVEQHLNSVGREGEGHPASHAVQPPHAQHHSGCPGSMARVIAREETAGETTIGPAASELRQWPVQLHLVPPTAPWFQNADILIAADCVAFALGSFHRDLLKGKALAIACPKLDETGGYVEKLAAIFRENDVKSVTVAIMEVPCCRGLDIMVKQALGLSGKDIALETVTIGIQGDVKK